MTDINSRLSNSLMSEYQDFCARALERVSPLCESPIEALLGAAIIANVYLDSPWNGNYCPSSLIEVVDASAEDGASAVAILIAQYPWRRFRIDWAVKNRISQKYLFVECDGHDFHERTKEQAERDRSRDREITEAGIPLLRFTGREIVRNAGACAMQVLRATAGLTR